ncbi:mCG1030209 [Mus musculus]|nr:mCG1030209 [Mus musculus]
MQVGGAVCCQPMMTQKMQFSNTSSNARSRITHFKLAQNTFRLLPLDHWELLQGYIIG